MTSFIHDYEGSLDSKYYIPQKALAATTNPQTANQIAEATQKLSAGVSGIDLSLISPEVFEAIPKKHFEEIRRLSKVTDSEVGLHAPVIDLAGFGKERWSENQREKNQRQIGYFIDMAQKLNPEGNTPINFHASGGVPGTTFKKLTKDELQVLPDEEAERIRKNNYERTERIVAVNQDTGQLQPLDYEIKEYVGRKKVWTPEERLEQLNLSEWDQEKLKLLTYQKEKAEVEDRLNQINNQIIPLIQAKNKNVITPEEESMLNRYKRSAQMLHQHSGEINTHLETGLQELHHRLQFVEGKENKREAEKLKKSLVGDYEKRRDELKMLAQSHNRAKTKEERQRIELEFQDTQREQLEALQVGLNKVGDPINGVPAPQHWKPSDDFAMKKTAETMSNAALEAYDKYKDKTPTMLLENVYPDWTLSRAKTLKKTIEDSRDEFAKKLVKRRGLSESKAKEFAEKLIGATWDVGHINMLRKEGAYTKEDILKETRKIAPLVKKLHLTDNFGFNDTHLPPGMGNVPVKEQIEELGKAGFKFEKGKVVEEAGGFWVHFKENPMMYTAEGLGTPLYSYETRPTWPEIWYTEPMYSTGYGEIFPETHFKEMYGGGWTSLPRELGGQGSTDKSRFAGTPNQ